MFPGSLLKNQGGLRESLGTRLSRMLDGEGYEMRYSISTWMGWKVEDLPKWEGLCPLLWKVLRGGGVSPLFSAATALKAV